MAVPELVVVPARPADGDSGPVEFEVRTQIDGRAVLPMFSSVAGLVRELGHFQPWVCVPWQLAGETARQAGLVELVLDPVLEPSGERWTATGLTASSGKAGAGE